MRDASGIDAAWQEAQQGRRAHHDGDVSRVIVEQLVDLDYELTMLTVSSSAGIVVCTPIGQRQQDGDYRESWQPADVPADVLQESVRIAREAVRGLVQRAKTDTAWGVFGVELFVLTDGSVLFNEVSPRPHDTGMVTMISQRLSEFDLHARAILGVPVTEGHVALAMPAHTAAASHAIVVSGEGEVEFRISTPRSRAPAPTCASSPNRVSRAPPHGCGARARPERAGGAHRRHAGHAGAAHRDCVKCEKRRRDVTNGWYPDCVSSSALQSWVTRRVKQHYAETGQALRGQGQKTVRNR